jgi:hypothetical protein
LSEQEGQEGKGLTPFFLTTKEGWRRMPRIVLLWSSMLLVTFLASGIAWASIDCKAKTTCKGNDKPNVMFLLVLIHPSAWKVSSPKLLNPL